MGFGCEDVLFFVAKLWNVVMGMEEQFKLGFLLERSRDRDRDSKGSTKGTRGQLTLCSCRA